MRKYEIQLPFNYRDGRPIEQEKIRRVREELLAEFRSFALPNERALRYDGVTCVEIMKFEILTDDRIPKERLKNLKTRMTKSLGQIDISITTQGVQLI